ncbi:MAG: hypothetical protein H6659_17645 [Ardenticatenaceae bacterium]|nr:hypothetical protein [Ardenticatenaceae bacterium]
MSRHILSTSLPSRLLLIAAALVTLAGLLLSGPETAVAQQVITPLYSQDFNGIGTSASANLPTHWRADKNTTVRTLGTWSAAGTTTERIAGNYMPTNAGNGIYNFGAGVATSATDRAVGWVSSSSGTKSGNLYLYLNNNIGTELKSIAISYNVEKYRNGSNTAGFSVQLYYSTDGSNWTSAGSTFLTSFPGGDIDNSGFAEAPDAIIPVTGILTFATPIGNANDFYLAWNYSVTTGTTTTNAQALGIDDVNVSSTITVDSDLSEWSETQHKLGGNEGVEYYLTWDATFLYIGLSGGNAVNGNDKYNVAIDTDPDDKGSANSGTINEFNGVTFGDDGKPDYVVQLNNDNTVYKKTGASNWADDWTSADTTAVDNDADPGQVEFRLKWADMGLTDRQSPVGVYVWQSNQSNLSWGSFPPTNLGWTGDIHPLTTRIYLPTTDNGRIPRTYAQHLGDQTQFDANNSFNLLNGFAQLNITSGGGTGCTFKVTVKGNAPSDADDSAVRRQYVLEPSGCTPTADITLTYMDGNYAAPDERNGYADTGDLKLFHWDGNQWVNAGGTADDANNKVLVTGVSSFSAWTFATGTGPTAVSLQSFAAHSALNRPALLAVLLVLSMIGGTAVLKRRASSR